METRLQTLRRLRSERRLLEVAAEIALLQRAGWACVGCGCSIDDYSLDCARCWDRARRHKDGRWRPEMQASAISYLDRRRLHGAEKNAAAVTERALTNPWHGHAAPIGAQGHYGAF